MRCALLLVLSALCFGLGATASSAAAATPTAPPGPGRANGFLMAPAGAPAKPGGTSPMTYFHGGLNVWVNAHAADRGKIVFVTRDAVRELRRYGVRIRYKGVAKNRAAEKGTRGKLGVVQVNSLPGNDRPCRRLKQGKPGLGARVRFRSVARYPGLDEIESADIALCPSVFHETKSTAVALHEFGHVVGLGNISTKYRGAIQIMQVTDLLPIRYQAGDRNGLRFVNYQSRALARPISPQGKVGALSVQHGLLRVRGWIVTSRAGDPATFAVEVDGARDSVGRVHRFVRRDIARRFHTLENKPGFSFTTSIVNRGRHRVCVIATVAGTGGVRLGCSIVSEPGSAASPSPSHSSAAPRPSPSAASSAAALPGADRGGSSALNIGLIAGIAGAAVVLAGIIALLMYNRRHEPAAVAPLPEPMQFWPTLPVQPAQPPAEELGRPPAPPPALPPATRPQHLPPPQTWSPQPPRPDPDDQPGG